MWPRWSVEADEPEHAAAVIAEADRLWREEVSGANGEASAAASGSMPPRLGLGWVYAAVGQKEQAEAYARAEWDRLILDGERRDTGAWAKQSIWLAETFLALGDLDRARMLWRRAEIAARGLGHPQAETATQLAVAVSMLITGDPTLGRRAMQRVADGPAKDGAIFEVVSKLGTYDPDIRPLIEQIGDASVRTQAYLVLTSLAGEDRDRRDEDLRAALEAFALSPSQDKAGPLRAMLVQALWVHGWTDQAVAVGSGLSDVGKVWEKLVNAAAMEGVPLAEVRRLYEALPTSPSLKRTMAHDAVVALAQRGRPADAEQLQRDLFTSINHENASVRTGAIALAYLERAELSEAASQVARVRNEAVAREVLGPATRAAVTARHAALLQEAAALAGRSDDWSRFFTAAAEALPPDAMPRTPAEAAPVDPLPPEAVNREVALRELAAFVERPTGSADAQPTAEASVLARRLVEAAWMELRDAREEPPLHVRADLVRQMAIQRVELDQASALADRLFEEWAQAVPSGPTGEPADPASLLRMTSKVDTAVWPIGEAFAALDRRAEFERHLDSVPSYVLEQIIRGLRTENEAALPGIYASVLDLIVAKRGDEADEGRIDATIRQLLKYERPGAQEMIAMAAALPPRRRLSLLVDAASSQRDDAGLSTLLTEAERVLPDTAQAPAPQPRGVGGRGRRRGGHGRALPAAGPARRRGAARRCHPRPGRRHHRDPPTGWTGSSARSAWRRFITPAETPPAPA